MKGGFGCSPCCAPPQDPCPECSHYSADDYFIGATASFTLDGVAVPPVTDISGLQVTPPAVVRTACFLVNDAVKLSFFSYQYIPYEYWQIIYGENDCISLGVYANLFCRLSAISGECTFTFALQATRTTGSCSDTGGPGVLSSWEAVGSDCNGGIPEDCVIETLDWLSTVTVSASFAYAECECPP